MNRVEIEAKVKDFLINELEIEEDVIFPEAKLKEDMGIDSLDFVDIVMSIEDEFSVEVPDEAIDDIKSVGDLVKFIEENM